MKKLILIPIMMFVLAGTVVACGGSDDDLEVTDVWSRVTTPTQDSGAVYMTIESPEDDKLLKASVPASIAGKTEVHETVSSDAETEGSMDEDAMSDDSMSEDAMDEDAMGDDSMHGDDHDMLMGMRPVSSIDLPAGEEVILEPGGYHIMMMDLADPITDGETFQVTLTFEKAGEVEVNATARES
ncbi:MAG: copper chaperone PCu(A)C [Solirubrobacterales bacterium]